MRNVDLGQVRQAAERVIVNEVALKIARAARPAADLSTPLADRQRPIFLVAPPRSGSTVIYQALTNYYNVLYIDNLAARWYGDLTTGLTKSAKRFRHEPHNTFESHHGDTSDFGDHAPSECGAFWYRWLRRDDHYADESTLSGPRKSQIRREILDASKRFDMPLVFKNLNNGQRLGLINSCLPEARIVWIQRDTEAVVKSILQARRRLGVPAGVWWSVKPPNWREYLELDEEDMVTHQVAAIESTIAQGVRAFPESSVVRVPYDGFVHAIEGLGDYWGLARRIGGSLPAIRPEG